jgi:hypothetical protein
MLLSLLVSELMLNATKHAFEPGQEGKIEITLEAKDQGLHFTFADNGKGFSPRTDAGSAKGLGTRIMQGLVAQLRGDDAHEKWSFRKNGGSSHRRSLGDSSSSRRIFLASALGAKTNNVGCVEVDRHQRTTVSGSCVAADSHLEKCFCQQRCTDRDPSS